MNESISIVFGGDFCPTQHVESAVDAGQSARDLFGPLVDQFQSADFSVANLEYPLTEKRQGLEKFGSHKRGHPKTISMLKGLGVRLVTLANNHILDYGESGIEDTLATCQAAGIATVGAGKCIGDAQEPYRVTLKGRSFAFLGICENEFSVAKNGHGGACGLDLIRIHNQLGKLRHNHDFVIVLFHGGSEFTHYPSPQTIRICRYLVDCGASAVVAHHPHYVQGFEFYKDVPILYSLGKLFYTLMSDSGVLEVPIATLTLSIEANKFAVAYDFYRISLKTMSVVGLDPKSRAAMEDKFREYSVALSSIEQIEAMWRVFCERRKTIYLSILLGVPSWVMRVLRRLHMTRIIGYCAALKKKELLMLRNIMTCESHREASLSILEGMER